MTEYHPTLPYGVDVPLIGPPGPAGPPGPPGDPGVAGPGGTFVFTQDAPSDSWYVSHELMAYPSVTVVDTGGTEIVPNIDYIDENRLTIVFGAPTSGKAYLN